MQREESQTVELSELPSPDLVRDATQGMASSSISESLAVLEAQPEPSSSTERQTGVRQLIENESTFERLPSRNAVQSTVRTPPRLLGDIRQWDTLKLVEAGSVKLPPYRPSRQFASNKESEIIVEEPEQVCASKLRTRHSVLLDRGASAAQKGADSARYCCDCGEVSWE